MLIDDFNVEGNFPAILTNKNHIVNQHEFLCKLHQNKTQVEQLLLRHGALLFRGFPIGGTHHFSRFIHSLKLGKIVNHMGDHLRKEDDTYVSTEAYPESSIPLHQERSFTTNFPRHIYFYCEVCPVKGGETIIADARKIYSSLDITIKHRFEKKALSYISHHYQEKNRPALLKHPQTNELVWFNQAHLYHFNHTFLDWKNFITAKLFHWQRSTSLHGISFGDGSQIAPEDIHHIIDVMKQHTVKFLWQRGDVLILDNILTMHGRTAFQGQRHILTAGTA